MFGIPLTLIALVVVLTLIFVFAHLFAAADPFRCNTRWLIHVEDSLTPKSLMAISFMDGGRKKVRLLTDRVDLPFNYGTPVGILNKVVAFLSPNELKAKYEHLDEEVLLFEEFKLRYLQNSNYKIKATWQV